MNEYDWMPEARALAEDCWSDKEAVARRIAGWMDTAAQNQRNCDYYRGLLVQCGKIIGDRAYISDDGKFQPDVLVSKIPEILKTDYESGDIP